MRKIVRLKVKEFRWRSAGNKRQRDLQVQIQLLAFRLITVIKCNYLIILGKVILDIIFRLTALVALPVPRLALI